MNTQSKLVEYNLLKQKHLKKSLELSPSRIEKKRLKNATQYKLSLKPNFFQIFKNRDKVVNENEKGLVYRKGEDIDLILVDTSTRPHKTLKTINIQEQIDNNISRFGEYAKDRHKSNYCVEPAYLDLNEIYFNSADNPIQIQDKVILLDYVSYTEFDNGGIYFNFRLKHVRHIEKNDNTPNIFCEGFEDYAIKFKVDKPISITCDGALLIGERKLEDFFWYCVIYPFYYLDVSVYKDFMFFKQKFESHFFKDNRFFQESGFEKLHESLAMPGYLKQVYKVKRNENLKDLPWNEHELTELYSMSTVDYGEREKARRSMNRYLRLSNTKKAVDACFHRTTLPKSIRKLLIAKSKPFEFGSEVYKQLAECSEIFGANKVRNLITDKQANIDHDITSKIAVYKALKLGFSFHQFKKEQSKSELSELLTYTSDMIYMYEELLDLGVEVEVDTNKVKDFHDRLSPVYTMIKKTSSSAESIAIKQVRTDKDSKVYECKHHIVRSPRTAYELTSVGTRMRHCVSSYTKNYFYKQVDIALVEDKFEGDYVACIEHMDGVIYQAKMKYNKQVKENLEVLEVVQQWAKANNMKIATFDLTDTPEEHDALNCYEREYDKERVKLVQEYREKVQNSMNQGYGESSLTADLESLGVTVTNYDYEHFVRTMQEQLEGIPF